MVCFKQVDIYNKLFLEVDKYINSTPSLISQNPEPENIEERFALFINQSNIPALLFNQVRILKTLRTVKVIVENDIITSKLEEVCCNNNISFSDLRINKGELPEVSSEKSRIDLENFEFYANPTDLSKKKAYPLFDESELLYSYTEWKAFAQKQCMFAIKMDAINMLFMNNSNENTCLSYDTFKAIYYIYHGFYECYFATRLANSMTGTDSLPQLFLKENKDVMEYLNDLENIKPDNDTQIKIKKTRKQTSYVLIKNEHSFTHCKIVILAENLIESGYIREEDKNIFIGLFYANDTTYANDRKIIWNGSFDEVKMLFKAIFSHLKQVPRGTHYILSDVFVTNEGKTNGQSTLSNKDYGKAQKRRPEEYRIINDIVNKAKMYKEA